MFVNRTLSFVTLTLLRSTGWNEKGWAAGAGVLPQKLLLFPWLNCCPGPGVTGPQIVALFLIVMSPFDPSPPFCTSRLFLNSTESRATIA